MKECELSPDMAKLNITACSEPGAAGSAGSAGEVKESNLMEVEYDCVGENFVPGTNYLLATEFGIIVDISIWIWEYSVFLN